MFSFLSSKKDFDNNKNELNSHFNGSMNQAYGFMKSISNVDDININIDKMISFMIDKTRYIDQIPKRGTGFNAMKDVDNIRLFIALGLVRIQSDTHAQHKEHLKLNQLEAAKFEQKESIVGYKQYMNEYIDKLKKLRELSIDKEALPENTSYQIELKKKLELFILKTKYYIFDIYLNHYIQFTYLLFAINIYKNTEAFFKINAEMQKQLFLLGESDELLQKTSTVQDTDTENITNIKSHIDSLIEKVGTVSKFNLPEQKDIDKIQKINDSDPYTGSSGGGVSTHRSTTKRRGKPHKGGDVPFVTTAADGTIKDVLAKHEHFYEVYKNTRLGMPAYFDSVNNLIMSKIKYLEDMKNDIMKLSPKQYALFDTVSKKFDSFFSTKEWSKDYNIKQNEIVNQNMEQRLNQITTDIKDTMNNNYAYVKEMTSETDKQADILQAAPPPTPNINVEDPNTERLTTGGFVRSSTVFPKNNYER
jgi:hypothetical protein